ncbi:MAG TPA: acyl carrier protein, partial [Longimicrobiaceae bacterium]|nr:acyl carrier protein [Longimicrobiaceae bacterium]
AGPGERTEMLEAHVAAEVARVLGLGGELPDPRQGFFDQGMDSLMAVELRGRLQAALGRTLPTSTVFNYPTVHSLARFLAEGLPGAGEPRDGGPAPGVEPAVDDLGNLSDDQLLALLAGELENGD